MPVYPEEPVAATRQRLFDNMLEYMQGEEGETHDEWDCGYTEEHVNRCATIIDQYLAAIAADTRLSQEAIRLAVKNTVVELNELNEHCGGVLIETDQREDLCQLILTTARLAGLETDEDITEEWREW